MAEMWEVVLKGKILSNVETRTVFQWGGIGSPTVANMVIGVSAKLVAMYTTIGDFIPTTAWQSYAYELFKWNGESWVPQYETQYDLSPVQTNQGDIVSYQSSVVLNAVTTAFKTRGRKFIPGFQEAETLSGILSNAALVAFALFIVEWLTPMQVPGIDPYSAGVKGKDGAFHPFVGATVGSILGSLRRRKPGYGI